MTRAPATAERGRARRGASILLLTIAILVGVASAQDVMDPIQDADGRLRAGVDLDDREVGTRCVTPGAELEIAGIGRAVYDRIAVNSADGSARLSGGVCIEVPEVDLILRARTFEITGLQASGDGAADPPAIAATEARLDVGDWRLTVDALAGPIDALDLRSIRLYASGVVGRAASGRIEADDATYGATLRWVALATHDYRLDARTAQLIGNVLVLEGATGTPCVCGNPRFVLLGETVRADLGEGGATIREPAIRVLGVRIPLGRELELGDEGPVLELPFAVAGREDLGIIAIVRGRPRDGVRVELGAATEPTPWPLAVLEVQEAGDSLLFEIDGRGPMLDARRRRALGGGAWVAGFSETELRGDEPRLRAGAELGWGGRWELEPSPGTDLTARLDVRAGAEIAAEPAGVGDDDRPIGEGVAAARLPFRADARTGLDLGHGVRADLRATVAVSAYPGAPYPGRASWTLAPSVTVAGDDARLVLGAERRWTAGDGPFAFDAVEPRARLTADGRLSLGAFTAQARVEWRLAPEDPGAEELGVRAQVDLPLASGWTLTPAVRGELAGIAGGPAAEDWIEAELAVARGEDTRLSLRAREGLDPAALRDLVVAAQAPIRVHPALRVVPYLAVDVAPLLSGGGPELDGHGLRLYVDDCCGTFVLGYRMEDDAWHVELDLRLPPLDLGEPPLDESVLRDVPLSLPEVPGDPGGAGAGDAPPGGDPSRGPGEGGPDDAPPPEAGPGSTADLRRDEAPRRAGYGGRP